ncbi:MAG: TraR/DksA family transcriptional regulator [Nitrospinae bacterium]|nr:TraR/DksA family transcriptional regulator [Nitrospinota bacterium]
MKQNNFNEFKKVLKRKRAMLLDTDKHIDQDIKKEMDIRHGDDADLAESSYEQEMSFTLKTRGQDELRQIDEAIARIDNGEYGICAECGGDIPKKRLEVLPYSLYCVDCQDKVEKKVANE